MNDTAESHDAVVAAFSSIGATLPLELLGPEVYERLQKSYLPATIAGARQCADFLKGLGFLSQSEALFSVLHSHFPDSPAGQVGLAQIAMQRKDWDVAVRLWDTLLSRFPQKKQAAWVISRASALEELGCNGDVPVAIGAAVLDTASQRLYNAQSAMRRHKWEEALGLWDEVLASSPESAPGSAYHRTGRATALLELGQFDAARMALDELLRLDPWNLYALRSMVRLECAMGQHRQGLQQLRASPFATAEVPALFATKSQLLTALGMFDEARESFALWMKYAIDLDVLEMLFPEAPRLYDNWALIRIRLDLLQKLNELSLKDNARGDLLRARLQLALKNYTAFQTTAGRIGRRHSKAALDQRVVEVAAASKDMAAPDFAQLKVFGIGLSKTGTSSLSKALSQLGLRSLHWINPLTCDVIAEHDLYLFDAFTDIPVCLSFEKYFFLFPNSKFIYTTRPIESWACSFELHWQRTHSLRGFDQIKTAFSNGQQFSFGNYFREIHAQLFLGHPSAADAYMSYDRRVRHFFGNAESERFIEFNVFLGDGWAKLCRFLGKEQPEIPFPFENRRS